MKTGVRKYKNKHGNEETYIAADFWKKPENIQSDGQPLVRNQLIQPDFAQIHICLSADPRGQFLVWKKFCQRLFH